jgi:hypothetical protein
MPTPASISDHRPIIRMEVRAVRSGWMRPTRYEIFGDGRSLWTADRARGVALNRVGHQLAG